jgi:hypothetical protein
VAGPGLASKLDADGDTLAVAGGLVSDAVGNSDIL